MFYCIAYCVLCTHPAFTSPTRAALSSLGLSSVNSPNSMIVHLAGLVNDLKITTEERFAVQQEKIAMLERQKIFSTNAEADVGKNLVDAIDDPKVDYVTFFIPDRGTFLVQDFSFVTPSLLYPVSGTGKGEDWTINKPMYDILCHFLPMSTILLTAGRSSLLDGRGREQRADLVKLSRAEVRSEWPNVETMLEGKLNLKNGAQWKVVLGQGVRRAEAILGMQPWREFVIIPLFDNSYVAFFRLNRKYEFSFCEPIPCFTRMTSGNVEIGEGFHNLIFYLTHPAALGYIPCPVQLKSLRCDFAFDESFTICARSPDKAVFKIMRGDKAFVVKAFKDQAIAALEFDVLYRLQGVSGIPTLVVAVIVEAIITDINGIESSWWCYVIQEYCIVLTPSLATPVLISQFAEVLAAAASSDYVNNDISPDNLLLVERDGAFHPIISDWGLATSQGAFIGTRGLVLVSFCYMAIIL